MCITSAEAELSNTKILGLKKANGNHVLSYTSLVNNLSNKPNSMIFAIPGEIENMFNTSDYPDFMDAIWEDLEPTSKSNKIASPKVLQVGLYRIVYGKDINSVLHQVKQQPSDYMADIKPELSNFLANHYRGDNFVICLFKINTTMSTQPFMIEYKPIDSDILRVPMMDSNDGNMPEYNEATIRNHTLLFGYETEINFINFDKQVPSFIANSMYCGQKINTCDKKNGDYFIDIEDTINSGELSYMKGWNYHNAHTRYRQQS